MAMDEQMQHEVAHVKLDRAMTQVYLDMTNTLDSAEVGTTISSIGLLDAQDGAAELKAGIGQCFTDDIGLTMQKISDTEILVTAYRDGTSQTLTIEQIREDMEMLLMQADFQLQLAEMFAAQEEEAH